jgi:hypothetical protein
VSYCSCCTFSMSLVAGALCRAAPCGRFPLGGSSVLGARLSKLRRKKAVASCSAPKRASRLEISIFREGL